MMTAEDNKHLFLFIIKGEAALHILREQYGENWSTSVKAIFAGDDTTDEDAMKVSATLVMHKGWNIF